MITHWPSRDFRKLSISLLVAMLLFSHLNGQEQSQPSDAGEHSFVRVYAPLEKIISAAGNLFLLPMDRKQFENIVDGLKNGLPTTVIRSVSIDKATYTATLDDDGFVNGSGVFRITSTAEVPTEVNFGEFNIPIVNPQWRVNGQSPQLGLCNTGEIVLLVPQSDTFEFQWSLQADRDTHRKLSIQLCESLLHEFTIFAPTNVLLRTNRGTISSELSNNVRVWNVRVSGAGELTIDVVREEAGNRPKPYYSQEVVYGASDVGLEIRSTIHIEDVPDSTRAVEFQLSSGLQPLNVHVNDKVADWEILEVHHDGSQTITVDLPIDVPALNRDAASSHTRKTIQIDGLADIDIEKPQSLPRVSSPQCEWMQEAAYLNLSGTIVIHALELNRCQQVDDSDASDQSFKFEYAEEQGSVLVSLGHVNSRARFDVATLIEISDSIAKAQSIANINVLQGDLFEISSTVRPGWNVESVKLRSVDGQTLNFVERWEQKKSADPTHLQVSLRRPIDKSRITQMVITATRRLASNETYPVEALEALRFDAHDVGSRLVAVRNSDVNRITWTDGENGRWMTYDSLPALLRRSMELLETDALIALDDDASGVTFTLTNSDATFGAEVQLLYHVSNVSSDESVRVRVTPMSGAVRSLEVHLQGRDVPYRWTLDSDELPIVETVSNNSRVIRMPRSMDQPFTLIGRRIVPFDDEFTIYGIFVPGAQTQSGQVTVTSSLDTQIDVQQFAGVDQKPDIAASDDMVVSPRLRYRVSQPASMANRPLLRVRAVSHAAIQHSTVWLLQPTTIVDPTGQHRHVISMFVENHGENVLPVVVPNEYIVNEIHVDEQRVTSASNEPGTFQIPLPSANRYPVVRIEMTEPQTESVVSKRFGQNVRCPRIGLESPVLQHQWKVWTPPAALPTLPQHWNTRLTTHDVMHRFFGVFARVPGSKPFDFFSDQSWIQLFQGNTRSDALQSARLLVTEIMKAADDDTMTWDQTIQAFDNANRITRSATLIVPMLDSKRLLHRGISPDAKVNTNAANETDNAEHFFSQLDLGIIATRTHLYVTTAEALGMLDVPFEWTEVPNVVLVRDSLFSAESIDARISQQLDSLDTVSSWRLQDDLPRWQVGPPDSLSLVVGGWQLTIVPGGHEKTTLTYVDRNFVTRVSVVCFLLATGCAWIVSRLGAHWTFAAIVIIGAACLLLPSNLAAAGTMVFWGTVAGAMLHWSRRALWLRMRSERTVYESAAVKAAGPIIAGLFGLVCVSSWPNYADAQDQPYTSAPNRLESVYVPIDENGDPDKENDNVYLSRTFHDSLLEYDARAKGLAAKWLLRSVNYRATLAQVSAEDTVQITGIYEIETLNDDVLVRLPIPPEAMRFLQLEARLDRKPIVLQQDVDTQTLNLSFEDRNHYELELTYVVPVSSNGADNSISIPIVKVSDSTVQLSSFLDTNAIRVRSIGRVERDTQQREVTAFLGPIETLDLTWTADDSKGLDGKVTATQIGWLKVDKDSVRYELRLLLQSMAGKFGPLDVVVDSRLVPNESGDQPLGVDQLDGNRTRLSFAPHILSETEALIHVHFDIAGVTSVGKIRIPRVHVTGAEVVSSIIAASSNNTRAMTPWRTVGISSIPSSLFSEVWETATPPPTYTYTINDAANYSCVFAFESRAFQTEASLQASLLVGELQSDLIITATLDLSAESLYQVRLPVPDDVIVKEVSMLAETGNDSLNWSRADSNSVAVFLPERRTGQARLRIRGQLRHSGGSVAIPNMLKVGEQLSIYRKPGIQVVNVAASGYETATAATQDVAGISRDTTSAFRQSVWSKTADNAMMTLNVERTDSSVDLETLLLFAPAGDAYSYNLKCRINNVRSSGASDSCDSIRLLLPASWERPITVNAITVALMPSPFPNQQIVVLRPAVPFRKGDTIDLSGEIAATDERLTAQIGVTNGDVSRFFVAMNSSETEDEWLPIGMESLDSTTTSFGFDVSDYDVYLVSSPDASLVKSNTDVDDGSSRVIDVRHTVCDRPQPQVISDVSIVVQGDGGIAFTKPDGCVVKQISINGAVVPVSESDGYVTLPFARSSVEQRLRVVWTTAQFDVSRAAFQIVEFPKFVQLSTSVSESDQMLHPEQTTWQFRITADVDNVEFYLNDRKLDSNPEYVETTYSLSDPYSNFNTAFRSVRTEPIREVRVKFVQVDQTPVLLRLASAMIAVFVGVFAIQSRFKPISVTEADLWIYTGAIVCGIAWWLFLQPSLFGWVIVLGTLVIAWLTRW
ncbi:MAG: hypothetical protein KDB27_08735 [Planctomycetales bacterium]|nr:hypothetical protein [Planctomycetales bacterium]